VVTEHFPLCVEGVVCLHVISSVLLPEGFDAYEVSESGNRAFSFMCLGCCVSACLFIGAFA